LANSGTELADFGLPGQAIILQKWDELHKKSLPVVTSDGWLAGDPQNSLSDIWHLLGRASQTAWTLFLHINIPCRWGGGGDFSNNGFQKFRNHSNQAQLFPESKHCCARLTSTPTREILTLFYTDEMSDRGFFSGFPSFSLQTS
jgi:hypothetical protein